MGMLHISKGTVDVSAQEITHKTEAWTSEELQEGKRSGGLVYPPVLEGPRREWMYASPALGQGQVASRNSGWLQGDAQQG